MICIMDALAIMDDIGHRMHHPVTEIIYLAHRMHPSAFDYRMPKASGDRIWLGYQLPVIGFTTVNM